MPMFFNIYPFLDSLNTDKEFLSAICIRCRYQSIRSADAFVVRPTGTPQGTLCFQFTWVREKKEMTVTVPTSGKEIDKIPGRWGPRTTFAKAGYETKLGKKVTAV